MASYEFALISCFVVTLESLDSSSVSRARRYDALTLSEVTREI